MGVLLTTEGIMEKRISELRQQIERWRRTRKRQAAMPAELWEEAAQLAAQSCVSLVSRRLRLGHDSLMVRVLAASSRNVTTRS
ncbi:MAG: hypothetical protein AUK47_09700 [Deltaproteobacteria bacterium CG2_30_63_29]|nr:MAG: hypothetical protein AUK47_09700 [Deltaproteobacteria bacterium CG2_30_63_29]